MQIASKSNSKDIVYSAKDIITVINIPIMGYYHLVSPNDEIVYKTATALMAPTESLSTKKISA